VDCPALHSCPTRRSSDLFFHELASHERDEGNYPRALTFASHTLAISRAALGEEHPDTLTSRGNLASVLGDLGRLEEAEAEHRAVDRKSTRLNSSHVKISY